METEFLSLCIMLSYALKDIREGQVSFMYFPSNTYRLNISTRPGETPIFCFTPDSTNVGEHIFMVIPNYITTVTFPAKGNSLLLGEKNDFLNFLMRFFFQY